MTELALNRLYIEIVMAAKIYGFKKFTHLLSSLGNLRLSDVAGSSNNCILHKQFWSNSGVVNGSSKGLQHVLAKPKRPPNIWALYLQKLRPEIVKNNPGIAGKHFLQQAAIMWKDISLAEKEKLQLEHDKAKQRYSQEIELYNDNMSADDRKIDKMRRMEKRKILKLKKDLGQPAKPLTAYSLFTSDMLKLKNPALDSMKEIGALWKHIDQETKQKYQAIYEDNFKEYEKEIKVWEEKMIANGQTHLVRKKTKNAQKDKPAEKGS